MLDHFPVVSSLHAMANAFPLPRGLVLRDHHEPLDARSGLCTNDCAGLSFLVLEGELSVSTARGTQRLATGETASLAAGQTYEWRVTSLAAHFVAIWRDTDAS